MKQILSVTSIIFLLLSGACKSPKQTFSGRNPQIENKRWVLRELNGKPVSIPKDGKELTLKIQSGDNTYGAEGGCNTGNGMYTVQDEMIKLHSMATTKMACEQPQTETEYFQMLDKANRYELKKDRVGGVDKETLILYSDKIIVGKFEAVWLE